MARTDITVQVRMYIYFADIVNIIAVIPLVVTFSDYGHIIFMAYLRCRVAVTDSAQIVDLLV